MLPLRTNAPRFSLLNVVSGKVEKLEAHKGKKGTLIVFICNHCPFVVHLLDSLVEISKTFSKKEINTITISSNNILTHPQDGIEEMKKLALNKKFIFPYFFDETQEVAHNYQAACTPDFYLFDSKLNLSYRGRYDASRPGNEIPITGDDLHTACDLMLKNKVTKATQYPSMGCNIKWLEGNSPEELS
jgi:hypothetical protein